MNGKITYHQQVTYCGKPRCRKCREGIGHGPYWYAYQTKDGQTLRTYIGKRLPPTAQATMDAANSAITSAPVANADDVSPTSSPVPNVDPNKSLMRIFTLGQFRIERRHNQQWHSVTDSAWLQHTVRSLLGYLLCSPRREASRTQIIAALWPTLDRETATNRLNKTMQNLRKILGHPAMETSSDGQETSLRMSSLPLLSDGEFLSLAGQEQIWIDADAFEERFAISSASDLSPDTQEEAAPRERLLREMIALYSGTFLPEEQDADWASARRQTLRRHWISLLLELANLHIANGTTPAAIDVLDRLLASDPTNEPAVQRLIIVLSQLKRRGEALRAYQRFAEVLQREFTALPSEETRALYEAVRQGGGLPPHLLATLTGKTPSTPSELLPAAISARFGGQSRGIAAEIIGRTNQSPLVGRAPELETMRSILLEVEHTGRLQLVGQRRASGIPLDTQRRPQCMVLMGEAGIGKTRLAEEVSREARQRGWSVIWSRLYTQESGVPYRLWTETLRKVLNIATGPDPSLLQPLTALLPELRDIIPPAIQAQAPPPHMLTPEQEQLRLWEAIGDLLKTISESTSLMIVLDDIQWADGSSHDLLGYLARHLYGYPVLFLGTCRDTELPKRPPHPLRKLIFHMQREHTIKTLNIEPLTSEQIGLLVSRTSPLPEATLKHIQDHAAGNPFFAEELARSTPPTLPRTVTAALEHRMNRLSQQCRQLLDNAAVLGGSFEFPVICAMESNRGITDEDVLLTLLEEALHAGVLTDEGTGTRITYHFWHPLLVSHLYDSISAIRRARLHLRAADILQRVHRGREEEVAATITYHLLRGGAEPAQIAHHAELAGNRSYSVFAYSEAEQHYRQAVENTELAALKDDQAHLASLLERFAECTLIRGHFADARQIYERVLKLRSELQDQAVDLQYEAQIQALLWSEIGFTWRYTGDRDNAHAWQSYEQGEQVLRAAKVAGGAAWARLYYLRSSLYQLEGRYEEAQRSAQEALTLFEEQQKQLAQTKLESDSPVLTRATRIQSTLAGDPINLGRIHRLMGRIADAQGQLTNVLTHHHKALALYEKYDEKRQIAHLSCDMGYIHLKKAEYELAQSELRRSHNLAEHIGDLPLLALVYSDWGEMAAAKGQLEEAEEWYRRALDLTEEDLQYISIWNAGLALVLQDLGKFDEAVACLRRAWKIGRDLNNQPCIALALVTLGYMRITQAISAEGIKTVHQRLLNCARQDVQRALAQGKLEMETRVRGELALAHITLLQGKREQAHEEIMSVITNAHNYELALVEERASQLLEQARY